jgi:hypothetical protein
MAGATGMPRRSWLRKSRAERPCCQHVRHTDIRTDRALAGQMPPWFGQSRWAWPLWSASFCNHASESHFVWRAAVRAPSQNRLHRVIWGGILADRFNLLNREDRRSENDRGTRCCSLRP